MKLIDKDAVVAEIENLLKPVRQRLERDKNDPWDSDIAVYKFGKQLIKNIDTLEVKEVNISNISENLAEAYEYLDFTHTSNLAHNKPMIAARLRRAIKELYNAGLFKLTYDAKYRMENLDLKAQKGEKV